MIYQEFQPHRGGHGPTTLPLVAPDPSTYNERSVSCVAEFLSFLGKPFAEMGFGIIWSVKLRITAIRNESQGRNGFFDMHPAVRSALELGTCFVSASLLFRPLNRTVLLSRMPFFLEAVGFFLILGVGNLGFAFSALSKPLVGDSAIPRYLIALAIMIVSGVPCWANRRGTEIARSVAG